MDRDTRWDRVKLAYDALVYGDGCAAQSAAGPSPRAYERGETDEFVKPTVIGAAGEHRVRDGDVCLFFNFRPDRGRELTRAFFEQPASTASTAARSRRASTFVTMTEYKKEFPLPVAFAPDHPGEVLADVLAGFGLRQLHIAETEKYAHVTFFFNGGVEKSVPGEERVLVPSPRDVPTYDCKPQMSALEVTDELVRRIEADEFDFIVVNYANADMVGHSGVLRGGDRRRRDGRCLPRPRRRGRPGARRGLPDHRRPRQLRPHGRARRRPQHGAQHQSRSRSSRPSTVSRCVPAACSPTSRRPCSICSATRPRR